MPKWQNLKKEHRSDGQALYHQWSPPPWGGEVFIKGSGEKRGLARQVLSQNKSHRGCKNYWE